MRKICVVIINRTNYGRLKPLLSAIKNHPDFELQIVVGSAMLVYRFGHGADIVSKDGFDIDAKLYTHIDGENNITMAKSVGLGLLELVTTFDKLKPDMVLTNADRYETIATAIAASYMNIPVIHTLGGEITGTIDEHVRHAVTKLAHIHFPAHEAAAKRIIQMGEDPKNVHITGNPALDIVRHFDKNFTENDRRKFFQTLGVGSGEFNLDKPYILCMQHPVTTEIEQIGAHISATIEAISKIDMPTIWFWPNNDAGSSIVAKKLREFREQNPNKKVRFFKNLEVEEYLRLLWNSKCIVGNSSSGIMEAGFMGVPCVNIGTRQDGRERCRNVVDVPYDTTEILNAMRRQIAHGKYEPDYLFGDGMASDRIVKVLSDLEEIKAQKRFVDQNILFKKNETDVKKDTLISDKIWDKFQEGVFVIAEAGKNFIQTEEEKSVEEYLNNAKQLVDEAAKAGADAIKFQTHNVEDEQLDIDVTSPHFQGSDRYNWVKRNTNSTPVETFWKPLKEYCDEKGVIFFSTPMSRGAAKILNELGVELWKVGSGDILDFVMLDYIRNTGKPIIISSGMSTLEETEKAINFLKEKNNKVALLHCVSKYPCPVEDLNLNTIKFYKEKFDIPIGFSDHSLDHFSTVEAVNIGATIIEKHFTMSRGQWGADHKVSLSPEEFKNMVRGIKMAKNGEASFVGEYTKKMMGSKEKILQEGEAIFRPLFRKSLMAGCDIPAGTMITGDMLYAMRPQQYAGGAPSEKYPEILGKVITRDIKKYEPITLDLIQ